MGLGWHVVLERALPLPPADPTQGRSLIFYQHELDELARRLAVPPLTGFVSAVPERVAEYLRAQGLDPDTFPVDDEEWFDATEGLTTVRGLVAHIRATPKAVTDPVRIVRDLEAVERVLGLAAAQAVRFHLASELPRLGPPGDESSSEDAP
jgi:hypothetical protein